MLVTEQQQDRGWADSSVLESVPVPVPVPVFEPEPEPPWMLPDPFASSRRDRPAPSGAELALDAAGLPRLLPSSRAPRHPSVYWRRPPLLDESL